MKVRWQLIRLPIWLAMLLLLSFAIVTMSITARDAGARPRTISAGPTEGDPDVDAGPKPKQSRAIGIHRDAATDAATSVTGDSLRLHSRVLWVRIAAYARYSIWAWQLTNR